MPLHSYRCNGCGSDFETLVRGDDVPVCPKCGGQSLERLIGMVAPDAKSKAVLKEGRAKAAKEGHFSNYSKSERSKI